MSCKLRQRDIEGRDFLRMSANLLEEIYCNFGSGLYLDTVV